jgi:four helix bundle protein
MNSTELKRRTMDFAVSIIKMADLLPNKQVGWTISNQIIRSSTSVAANYRAVCRAKSDKDFVYKMSIVIEEADETMFWIELIKNIGVVKNTELLNTLQLEANELVAIFTSSAKTVKSRLNRIKF